MKLIALLAFVVSSARGDKPAFLFSSSPSLISTSLNKALFAYTDDQLGRPNKLSIAKERSNHIPNRQLLPPAILPNGGKITMVGSGPGDPDLLTIAAHKILTDPSILVVSDRLVSPEILELIQGEIKVARKLPGCADEAQDEVSM